MSVPILRLFGPPGTGKTTDLARRVAATVAQLGPEAIRIASFSVTAAREIADRQGVGDVLPAGAVGTLHSHAYRAIEHPDVALDPKVLAGWNESVGATWRITGDTRGPRGLESRDRAGAGALETGDALLEELDLLRAQAVPPSEWPLPVRQFAKRWTGWKREVGAVDYTDMIVDAYRRARDGEPMPGNPQVLVVDEAQDLTTIEASLVLAWGERLSGEHPRLVFALDDDQAINEWRGGDPTAILDVEATDDVVLAQSWRVPPAVHAVAEQWIARCSTRYPKAYHPRGASAADDPTPEHSRGWAHPVGYSLNDRGLVDAIEADLDDPDLPGGTIMVIASCGYMLTPLIKMLKDRGIPFHNPFRPSEQAWNPLGKPGRGISTPERIWRYAVLDERTCGSRARAWTGDDLQAWVPLVDAKLAHLARGAKAGLDQLPSGTVPWELVADLWRDDPDGNEAMRRATGGDDEPADHLRWLSEVLAPAKAKVAGYPLEVARRHGPTALVDTPRVVLGTIHSTKGAQANRVYLAPDLSGAGMRQWRADVAGRDQAIRLFYVGLTRAYHSVRVLAPTSTNTVPVRELIPPDLEVRP